MKEYKQFGAYGLVIKDESILLIKKAKGPYKDKLDLPGGTIEFCEQPCQTLNRELKEETGIEVGEYELFDADSVSFNWEYKDVLVKVHHIGIFYKVHSYSNDIKEDIALEGMNDDSMGAEFYSLNSLKKSELSAIAILEIEKLGYTLKD